MTGIIWQNHATNLQKKSMTFIRGRSPDLPPDQQVHAAFQPLRILKDIQLACMVYGLRKLSKATVNLPMQNKQVHEVQNVQLITNY